jgi:Fur family transcriptional regulator, ferric uptake regulator
VAGDHHREHHTHDDLHDREEELLELLRGDGGRVTTGRRAIVRALLGGPDHHVTAEDVAGAVQDEHPDVHLSTVYRTLDALEALGVLERVNLGAGGAVYHLTDHDHHHLVCAECGSVTEAPADVFADAAVELERRYGFTVTSRVQVSGLCAACHARESAGSA